MSQAPPALFPFPHFMPDENTTTEPIPSEQRDQPPARLDILTLTLEDLCTRITPALVIRGQTGGSSVLTPGRGIHFILDPRLGAHVLRFKSHADFVANEARIRREIRANVTVETVLELSTPPEPVAPPPPPTPEPELTAAERLKQDIDALTVDWDARWEARAGVLRRTDELLLRKIIDTSGVGSSVDRRAPKCELEDAVLRIEKRQELEKRAVEGKLLPNVPEAAEWRAMAEANAPRRVRDAAPVAPVEPAAGTGAFLADAPDVPEDSGNPALTTGEIPAAVDLQKMPLDKLRELAAAHGIDKTDRRDIVRALGRMQTAGV